METLESGFVENKGVPACKRIGTLQFPIGDDVSALQPLRSSVGLLLDAVQQQSGSHVAQSEKHDSMNPTGTWNA
jgi:hypothetical protein